MTRQRAAAIERAVSAYRRLIRVDTVNTAMEMVADLIGYHLQFVDNNVDVDQLLADAKRRAETLEEDERESEPRQEDMYAPPTDEQAARQRDWLDQAIQEMNARIRQAPGPTPEQQQEAYNATWRYASGRASGPTARLWFSDEIPEQEETDGEG